MKQSHHLNPMIRSEQVRPETGLDWNLSFFFEELKLDPVWNKSGFFHFCNKWTQVSNFAVVFQFLPARHIQINNVLETTRTRFSLSASPSFSLYSETVATGQLLRYGQDVSHNKEHEKKKAEDTSSLCACIVYLLSTINDEINTILLRFLTASTRQSLASPVLLDDANHFGDIKLSIHVIEYCHVNNEVLFFLSTQSQARRTW